MNLLRIFPLLFLMVILGCIQQPEKKMERGILAPTHGLAVDISGGNITITKGSSFSLMVSIKNNGDFDANLKKVWLLGDILYIDGNVTKTSNFTLHKKEIYVEVFSPLTVSTTIGKNRLEFYPAICYSYLSEGRLSFYLTTNDQIFVSNRDKPLKKSSSNSPMFIDFEGYPITKLTESEGRYSGVAYFLLKIIGKNPNSWPVSDCNDLSNVSVKNITLRIILPPGLNLSIDSEHWTLKGINYSKECLEQIFGLCLSECYGFCCENYTTLRCLESSIRSCWDQCQDNENCLSNCYNENILGVCLVEECMDSSIRMAVGQEIASLGECLNYKGPLDECIEDIIDTYKALCKEKCVSECKNKLPYLLLEKCLKEYIFQLNSSYYSYLRSKQALRDIPISIKINSTEPIDLEEIIMLVNVTYDFYEVFPNEKAVFRVI